LTTKANVAAPQNREDDNDETNMTSRRNEKNEKKSDKKRHREEMVAMAKRATQPQVKRKDQCPEHFEKALEEMFLFHEGQTKHLLKGYDIMQSYIKGTLNLYKSKAQIPPHKVCGEPAIRRMMTPCSQTLKSA
jgi:hypothetical protein